MINTSPSSSPLLGNSSPAANLSYAAAAQGGARSTASARGAGTADETPSSARDFAGAMKQAVNSNGAKDAAGAPPATESGRAENAERTGGPRSTQAPSDAAPSAAATAAGTGNGAQLEARTGAARAATASTARLQAALAMARAKASGQDGAPALSQALARATQAAQSGKPPALKTSDTDPAGATPLPLPLPGTDSQAANAAQHAVAALPIDGMPQQAVNPETNPTAAHASPQSNPAALALSAQLPGAADGASAAGLQRAVGTGTVGRPAAPASVAADSSTAALSVPAPGPGTPTTGGTGAADAAKPADRGSAAVSKGANPISNTGSGTSNSATATEPVTRPASAIPSSGPGSDQQPGGSPQQGHEGRSAHDNATPVAGQLHAQRSAAADLGAGDRAAHPRSPVGSNAAVADASASGQRASQPRVGEATTVDTSSAWPAAWVTAPISTVAAGQTAAAQMPTRIEAPVDSAAFAAEAGYRIAVLVQGGVERAELQLNPIDMGPVTVQIAVDGLTAQVQLEALQADTRQALEAAMPQLASQLREAGLTLTGGGVFEQAPQQQGKPQDAGSGNPGQGSRREADGRGTTDPRGSENLRPARGSAGWQQRGVVDLVA